MPHPSTKNVEGWGTHFCGLVKIPKNLGCATRPRLLGQMPLERNCLLKVECLKAPMPSVIFKPAQRLCGGVHRGLAVALGFFQVGEVFALYPLVFRVVFRHGFSPLLEVTVYDGKITLT